MQAAAAAAGGATGGRPRRRRRGGWSRRDRRGNRFRRPRGSSAVRATAPATTAPTGPFRSTPRGRRSRPGRRPHMPSAGRPTHSLSAAPAPSVLRNPQGTGFGAPSRCPFFLAFVLDLGFASTPFCGLRSTAHCVCRLGKADGVRMGYSVCSTSDADVSQVSTCRPIWILSNGHNHRPHISAVTVR